MISGFRFTAYSSVLRRMRYGSFAVSIGEYFYGYFKRERDRKKAETKKGWHEDHSKVARRDYPFKERMIKRIVIPRIRVSFPVLITN